MVQENKEMMEKGLKGKKVNTGTLKTPTDLSVSERIPSPSALLGEPLRHSFNKN